MKRLLLAGLMAAGIHVVLLSSGAGWFSGTIHRAAHDRALSLTLVSVKPVPSPEATVRKKAAEIGKTTPAAPRKTERKPPRKPTPVLKTKPPRRVSLRPKPKEEPTPVPAPRKPEILSHRTVPVPNAISEEKRSSRSVKEEKAAHSEQAQESRPVSEEIVRDALTEYPGQGPGIPEQGPSAAGTELGPSGPAAQVAIPLYLENPRPKYPELARRRRFQGTVIVEVLVKKDGRAGDVRVSRSSGHPSLDRAALAAVRKWLFKPGSENGTVVDMRVKIPIRFQLN